MEWTKKSDLQTATSYTLNLHVKSEGVFNDIEMGVLDFQRNKTEGRLKLKELNRLEIGRLTV